MKKYKIQGDCIKDQETGGFIPKSEGNRHYREYLIWLEEGNTPDPEMTQEEKDAEDQRTARRIKKKADADAELRAPDSLLAMDTAAINDYINTNAKDFQSARVVMRKMARTIVAIAKKLDLDE